MGPALWSMIALSIAVVADSLMSESAYQRRPLQPLFVSAVLNFFMALLVIAIHWSALGFPDLLQLFLTISFTQATLTALGGALTAGTLYCYFAAFASKGGEPTEISIYIAVTPVIVLIVTTLTAGFGGIFPDEPLSIQQIISISAILLGLLLFAYQKQVGERGRGYRGFLIGLLILNTSYNLLLDLVYGQAVSANPEYSMTAVTSALMPYYWLGFAMAGVLPMLFSPQDWRGLLKNSSRIKSFWKVILFVEVAGMATYYLEIWGIGIAHPAIVATIIGLHVMIVFLIGLGIRSLIRKKLEQDGWIRVPLRQQPIPAQVVAEAFPLPSSTLLTALAIILVLLGIPFAL